MPLSLYSTFVIEARHGFNNQTLSLFISDTIKSLLLMAVLGVPVIGACLWVILKTGEHFYIYLYLLVVSIQVIFMTIIPVMLNAMDRIDYV